MTILCEINDRILLVTIDNPPVNALSQSERKGLLDAIEFAESSDIDAVVICGAQGNFIAGADVCEFDQPSMLPHLPDVIARMEASEKPLVAAIEGAALGSGLEVALGCHYRIAKAGARFGMPEVTLGVVPGAGGSQRLPRLADPLVAIRMIVGGKPVDHAEALAIGLVDVVVEGELIQAALQFARDIAGEDLASRRVSRRPMQDVSAMRDELDAYAANVRKSARGAHAPVVAMELMEATLTIPFEEGVVRERETFLRLRGSEQAAALNHIFLAERAATKPPADVASSVPRLVERVGVVGAGTMGAGIAMDIANNGLPVQMIELSEDAVNRGLSRISKSYQSLVSKGRLTAQEAAKRIDLIKGGTDYLALAQCDLIIEAAVEAMEVKKEIFTKMAGIAKPNAILASNTSYLDLNLIAQFSGRPSDVVGMHYFSPAEVMKLMEVVRGKETAPDVLVSALAFAKRTNKIPVVAGVCNGFIGNRMFKSYVREAGLLLLEGATPQEIDAALTGFGMAMGPFAVADLTGIDIAHKARAAMVPGSYEPMAVVVHDALVEAGHLGRKTGRGFYLYGDDVGAGTSNPYVNEILSRVRGQANIYPRSIANDEIVHRCILALVDEAELILEEGIAARPGDIDVAYVNGYGFPRYKGGPMFYAKTLGDEVVGNLIKTFADGSFGHWWNASRGS